MSPAPSRLAINLRLTTLALLAAALLFVLPSAVRAQGIGAHRARGPGTGGTATLEGNIITPTGVMPESNMRVRLVNSESRVRITVPDGRGAFTFSSLESGYYTLHIDAGKNYERVEETIYIDAGNQNVSMPVYLRLRPEANPALAGVPKDAVDLFVKALEASRKGESEKAVSLLEQAVAQHAQFGLAHGELGLAHMRAGRLDKALESFRAAQKALPEDAEVQLNYGVALTQKKDFSEAEKQLRRALKKMDKSASGHMYLGVALIGLKDIDGAERELRQAAKLGGSQMGAAHKYLGGIYWARKDYRRAADELETYVKLSPKAPDAEQVKATIKELRSKQ
jgi:Flp pilus assembly protein TadD